MTSDTSITSAQKIALARNGFPRLSLARALFEGCKRSPHKQMVVGMHESITYASSYRKANELAWHMRVKYGLCPGDTVVIATPNLIAIPYIIAAAQMCGARLAHFSPELEREDFERCARIVNPKLFIVSSTAHCLFASSLFPDSFILSVGCWGLPVPRIEDVPQIAMTGSAWEFLAYQDDTEIVLFSSGSTGTPKAIVNKAFSFSLNAVALQKALTIREDDVLYIPVPFAHVFGIVGIYAALLAGATIVTSAKYRPETALTLIMNTRATLHFGVSTMFLRELRTNQDSDWDLSSLRAGLVGGASCPELVLYEFEKRWGCRLMQSYGMTETSATLTATSLDLPVSVRARSVGVGVSGTQIKLDASTKEILCKSPSMMLGVIDENGGYKLDLDDGGWLRTGDVGSFDVDGRLSIVGRLKEMIIRGGVNIFPAEIEGAYQSNADISESCLIGYDDPDLGERTCLCVIMKEERSSSTHDLRMYASGRMEKCKIPDIVLKMEEFPHLANGKINRIALRDYVKNALDAPMRKRKRM